MRGYPKFKNEQRVKFKIDGNYKEGCILVVDRYGTFENPTDVSYDIMVESENCFYKHITEKLVEPLEEKA